MVRMRNVSLFVMTEGNSVKYVHNDGWSIDQFPCVCVCVINDVVS